ncbi:precorrin-3B C(17)-methyltransferase [Halorutilales archaeon Cl-col2-1]
MSTDSNSTTDTSTDTESKCGGSTDSSSSSGGCTANTSDDDLDTSDSTWEPGERWRSTDATAGDESEFGSFTVVGLGPGSVEEMTQKAIEALDEADHIVGYETYVDLLPEKVKEGTEIFSTPMCGEVSRTEEAVDRVLDGNDTAIIGSGDPNVYALGSLSMELLESKGATPEAVDFDVVAGIPAAQSCGARLGAPFVNDTVTVSLSDYLTPMPEIESRLHSAAREEFTIVIYNPWSRKRRDNFEKAVEILQHHRPDDTPVGIVRDAGREDEVSKVVPLGELDEWGETDLITMTTTLIIGNDETYVWNDKMVTPRGYHQKYDY